MNEKSKRRLQLAALLLVFALPLGIAWLLSSNGWHPQRTRSSGVLVDPPRNLANVVVTLKDGRRLDWTDAQLHWTLLAMPGLRCGTNCMNRLEETLRMRITLTHDADRLRIVYLGPTLPSEFVASHQQLLMGRDDTNAFAHERARADDSLALALVDPRGWLMMRYPDGYSAQGLRSDIKKVIY
ncbi:MAG: hypothetical protein WBV39_12750 [Rudaea sp.]